MAGIRRVDFRRIITPVRMPLLGFAGLILAGTVLLCLPVAAVGPRLHLVDALFTATSAVCVTGLVVVDTGTRLSLFGQGVVLALIQCGGLGIMTLSTVLILVVSGRFTVTGRRVIQDTFTHGPGIRLTSLIWHVVFLTLAFEAAGALLLLPRFAARYDLDTAFYYAVFHAVSAFCNAGFCLYTDSFVGWQRDWLLNGVVCGLIISGGLGFLVLMELKRLLLEPRPPRRLRQLSLHTKMVIVLTGCLLAGGTLIFLLFEWNDSMAGLSPGFKVLAAFFQSVTARTAGFNTLDFGHMANVTLVFTLGLMFVGAASGSTGGGIKVNTLGVLLALCRSRLRGEEHVNVFRRTIHPADVGRAIAVFALAVVVIYGAAAVLTVTELGDAPHAASRGLFLELLFEVVSAFGTVGLSMGATSGLTLLGKLVIVAVMFIGRLGPLTIGLALARREPATRYQYAEEHVMIG